MKKINGTLYSPVVDGDREKMYVETVPEAVIMHDGSTLKEALINKSKGLIVSTEKPNHECIWLIPVDSTTAFDFSDVTVDIPEVDAKIHTLKSPTNSNGVRENVYPLTSSKNVNLDGVKSLDDIFSNYDMGIEVGRNKPNHKATWCLEESNTARINDLGRLEDVYIMNDYLASEVTIGHTEYTADEYVFNINGDNMILFDPVQNSLVVQSNKMPNKQCLWISDAQ